MNDKHFKNTTATTLLNKHLFYHATIVLVLPKVWHFFLLGSHREVHLHILFILFHASLLGLVHLFSIHYVSLLFYIGFFESILLVFLMTLISYASYHGLQVVLMSCSPFGLLFLFVWSFDVLSLEVHLFLIACLSIFMSFWKYFICEI